MKKFIIVIVFLALVNVTPSVVAFSGFDYLDRTGLERTLYLKGYFDGMPGGMALAGMQDKRLIPQCVSSKAFHEFKNDVENYMIINSGSWHQDMYKLIVDMLVQKCGKIRID
ncbi:MAG: hypothetical protein L0Z68_02220 [Gammaproteobacteria bacterium]|nr:hypothetical protein [Gammaproteobacteria bacterium]